MGYCGPWLAQRCDCSLTEVLSRSFVQTGGEFHYKMIAHGLDSPFIVCAGYAPQAYGTKLGRFWDEIGTALELTQDSIYVTLSMLKTVITSENDSGRTPMGVFFHAPAAKDSAQRYGRCFRFPGQKGGN